MRRDAEQLVRLARLLAPLLRHRWALRGGALLAVALGIYLVAVPWLNRTWGLKLPGWSELVSATAPDSPTTAARRTSEEDARRPGADASRPSPAGQPPAASRGPQGSNSHSASRDERQPSTRTIESAADGELAAILSGASRAVYESPQGLRYTRGSQHGHRLLHLMAHARDEPQRSGSHGVFDQPGAVEIIALVDEAYRLAMRGVQTETQSEGERQVYTVDLRRRIGYVGGENGKRLGHPPARRLRLVVDDENVVTAFPVR